MKNIPLTPIEAFRRDAQQYVAMKQIVDAINEERTALEKGTYVEFPQYGKWGSVWVGAHAMRDDASNPPLWGSIWCPHLPGFENGDMMHGTVEIPETFVYGGQWAPTVVFTFAQPPTAGTIYTWVLGVEHALPRNARSGVVFNIVGKYTAGAGDDKGTPALRMPFPPKSVRPGSIIIFHLSRSGADTPEPYLLGISWQYEKRVFGLEARP